MKLEPTPPQFFGQWQIGESTRTVASVIPNIASHAASTRRQITAAQLLSFQLGKLKDADQMHHTQVSMVKWSNCRMALDVARDARDLLGAGGVSLECSPIRHMLNLESVITYEGTETIHQLIVGREITGVAAM